MARSTEIALSRSGKLRIRAGLRLWREDPEFSSEVAALDGVLEGLSLAELREIIEGSFPIAELREITGAVVNA